VSPAPELTAHQKFDSHMVNCRRCKEVITKHASVTLISKIVDWLCPVGQKLYKIMMQEDPRAKSRPMNFPFIPKMYETVVVMHKGKYLMGKVVDKSISASGSPMGYEVEISTPQKYNLPDKITRIYVNQLNIFKANKTGAKPKEVYDKKSGSITIRIGSVTSNSVDSRANERSDKVKIKLNKT
jgi:hypothetical protein